MGWFNRKLSVSALIASLVFASPLTAATPNGLPISTVNAMDVTVQAKADSYDDGTGHAQVVSATHPVPTGNAIATVSGSAASATTLSNFPYQLTAGASFFTTQWTAAGAGNVATYEGSNDNSTFQSLNCQASASNMSSGLTNVFSVNTTNPISCWTGGFAYVRIRISTYGSGTPAATSAFFQNGNPFTAATIIGTPSVVGSIASGSADSGNPVKVGAKYNSSLPTFTNGQRADLQTGTRGSLNVTLFTPDSSSGAIVQAADTDARTVNDPGLVTNSRGALYNGTTWDRQPGTAAGGAFVSGSVASGAADSGNPVKVGGKYEASATTVSDGQRTDLKADQYGSLSVRPHLSTATGADGDTNSLVAFSPLNSFGGNKLWVAGSIFNGSTWDREFTCTSTATVSVTAGNTTQIVGLSGSTVIRICSIGISMSAAGSAGVYTGTGTNCGTGTTALIQDMTLPTGTPFALSAPSGGSLVRSSAGGEICVKAVTGNVTGFLSYAQY